MNPVLVTGGAGFIGSNLVRYWLAHEGSAVINLDNLTYAGNLLNLSDIAQDPRYTFVQGDIGDSELVAGLLERYRPGTIIHLAAESHVDRSLHGPDEFVQTNIVGTHTLLRCAYDYWRGLAGEEASRLRFIHVSTDEVYGSLAAQAPPFTESSPYQPSSPYAASKAAADHLVRAYHTSFGLPVIVTNCSNNFGPFQYPEKLIPLMINNALQRRLLPVYGDGSNIRDWLYVEDHCAALYRVAQQGRVGETYNISAANERDNLAVVREICRLLDQRRPAGAPHEALIEFVQDRPGHDRRYALDAGKLISELGWAPRTDFTQGLRATVDWYLEHRIWVGQATDRDYQAWVARNYGNRGVA